MEYPIKFWFFCAFKKITSNLKTLLYISHIPQKFGFFFGSQAIDFKFENFSVYMAYLIKFWFFLSFKVIVSKFESSYLNRYFVYIWLLRYSLHVFLALNRISRRTIFVKYSLEFHPLRLSLSSTRSNISEFFLSTFWEL